MEITADRYSQNSSRLRLRRRDEKQRVVSPPPRCLTVSISVLRENICHLKRIIVNLLQKTFREDKSAWLKQHNELTAAKFHLRTLQIFSVSGVLPKDATNPAIFNGFISC